MKTNIGSWFETRKRDNGETFCALKEGHPAWLQEAIHEAHAGDLPCDWIYTECRATVDAYDAGDLGYEDAIHEFADGRVGIYTKDLFLWAADECLSSTYSYAEEEASELLEGSEDTTKRFMTIQYCAIRRIAETMRQACEENSGTGEESEAAEAEGVTP